jgi:hypothetical protein
MRQRTLLLDQVQLDQRSPRKAVKVPDAAQAAEAVNLTVNEEGLYRVPFAQLKSAGLDLQGVPANEVALTSQGESVPVYVGIDYIEFFGQGLDSLYSADNVYTVQVDAALAKQVVENNQLAPRKANLADYYMETLNVDEDKVLFSYLTTTEPWVNGWIYPSTVDEGGDFPFNGVENYLAGTAPVAFTADLWGGDQTQHQMRVALNGTLLSDKAFYGITKQHLAMTLPEGVLQDGQNVLRLTTGKSGGDLLVYDKLSVTYPRAFVARDGELIFSAAAEAFRVENLESRDITVYRIMDGQVERLNRLKTRYTGADYTATFAGSNDAAKYVVVDDSAIKSPAAVEKVAPQVDITSGTVNTLIIAHPDFIGTDLDRLADTRRAQGYSVKIVDVTQIYAQFGDYLFDPTAIKDYLTYAIQNMDVQMVLLVGGDTYDYQNYVSSSVSFIPSLYAQTTERIKFAAVDPSYVDPDGDQVPNIPIGRLPVRSSVELSNLIEKTEAYTSNTYNKMAVFAADNSYTADSIALAGMLPDWSVTKANIGEVGTAAAKQTLVDSINNGVALTSYFGHSASDKWAHENLFTITDATALTNIGKPTVVTQYGCWNTYYVSPNANTLSHKLLLAENGAAAVTGATALSNAVAEAKLGELMVPAMVSGKTIGEAMQESKEALALTDPGLVDVQLGWTILGVPWLEVK